MPMQDEVIICSSIIRRRTEKIQGRTKLNFRKLQTSFPKFTRYQECPMIKYQQPKGGEKNNKFSVSNAIIISPL